MHTREDVTESVAKSGLIIGCIIKALKAPLNWLVIVLAYIIWSLVGMRYSTHQHFNMIVTQQSYVMCLSLVSISAALINHNTKMIKLALIGSITFVISFVAIAADRVELRWLGYPLGYYLFSPVTLLLFLLQIKQICSFACSGYYEIFKKSNDATDIRIGQYKTTKMNQEQQE